MAGVVDVNGHVRIRRRDRLDCRRRNAGVVAAEMEDDGAARRLAQQFGDAPAIVAGGGRHPLDPARRQPRRAPAPAVADHEHRGRQGGDGGGEIGGDFLPGRGFGERAPARYTVGVVAGLESGLAPIEKEGARVS